MRQPSTAQELVPDLNYRSFDSGRIGNRSVPNGLTDIPTGKCVARWKLQIRIVPRITIGAGRIGRIGNNVYPSAQRTTMGYLRPRDCWPVRFGGVSKSAASEIVIWIYIWSRVSRFGGRFVGFRFF